ncbi:MAG: nucleoside-diphosphate kinase [Nanoarchaeota archaeon]
MVEKTLVIVKHDGVLRGLVGEILKRFENTGLKIVGMKMVWASEKVAREHYVADEAWANGVFNKAKTAFQTQGKVLPFDTAKQYGDYIQKMNQDYLKEGPVVAMVFEGYHAVEVGRKLSGNTEPRQALPGTIRGDFMFDSYSAANSKERSVRNLIHSSGTVDEANREISLWFDKGEIHNYSKDLDKHHN